MGPDDLLLEMLGKMLNFVLVSTKNLLLVRKIKPELVAKYTGSFDYWTVTVYGGQCAGVYTEEGATLTEPGGYTSTHPHILFMNMNMNTTYWLSCGRRRNKRDDSAGLLTVT
jgi:hypothetical protein